MHLEPLKGIIVFDKESLKQTISDGFKIWGQITLTFRYGREDEEVLGLRFCNEAILALKQLWPPLPKDPEYDYDEDDQLTSLQVTHIYSTHTVIIFHTHFSLKVKVVLPSFPIKCTRTLYTCAYIYQGLVTSLFKSFLQTQTIGLQADFLFTPPFPSYLYPP